MLTRAQILKYREQVHTLTDGLQMGIKKVLLYKNKAIALEQQMNHLADRYAKLQKENDHLQRMQRIHQKTMKPMHSTHAPINLTLGQEIVVTNDLKQRVEMLMAENESYRVNDLQMQKELTRLKRECVLYEVDAKKADDRLRIERQNRETLEKVRRRAKNLEKKLEAHAREEVRKQQMNKRVRQEKVWDRIGRD